MGLELVKPVQGLGLRCELVDYANSTLLSYKMLTPQTQRSKTVPLDTAA